MKKAVANQTFHYSGGTIPGGAEFDDDHPLVKEFSTFFDIKSSNGESQPGFAPTKEQMKKTLDDGYEEQPISVLRNLAKQKKLDSNGTKEDLVNRLRESDAK